MRHHDDFADTYMTGPTPLEGEPKPKPPLITRTLRKTEDTIIRFPLTCAASVVALIALIIVLSL